MPYESDLNYLYKESKVTYQQEEEGLISSYLAVLRPVLEGLAKDAKILEIGCGRGFLLTALYDMGYKNIFGVETSLQSVSMADTKVRERIAHDVFKPEVFPDQQFKFIFFFQVLEYIFDVNIFINLCREKMLPGGYIPAFNHDIDALQAKLLKTNSPIIDIEHSHLLRLVPLFGPLKERLLKSNALGKLLGRKVKVRLGNLCLVAQKPSTQSKSCA
ncbi:methyltransferase domain-containing protein [Candidatus Omnitrophota bacterium]